MTEGPPEQTEAEPIQAEAVQAEAVQAEASEGAPTEANPVAVAPTEEERRRRRAAVFGDVLPESTRDDRADASERGPGSAADGYGGRDGGEDLADEWLRREVPPHHG